MILLISVSLLSAVGFFTILIMPSTGSRSYSLSKIDQTSHPNTYHNHHGHCMRFCHGDFEVTVRDSLEADDKTFGSFFIELDKNDIIVAVDSEDKDEFKCHGDCFIAIYVEVCIEGDRRHCYTCKHRIY